MNCIFKRESILLLLFLLAGLLFGWPFITLGGEGESLTAYLTFGAVVVIGLLFLFARCNQGSETTDEDM